MERSEYVENRLLRIGATPEYVGYPYLLDSILLVWDKPEAGRNITTQVYPAIAQRWGVSAASVERSIRTLIAALWQDQDRRRWDNCLAGITRRRRGIPNSSG